MADYAIGDVQGCYDSLLRLLDYLHFNEHTDRLWFVGDLVNRGPKSLEVLRFIRALKNPPRITLGNHDLHLLNLLFSTKKPPLDSSLEKILKAPDADELGHWLRQQNFLIHDTELNIVMCHAGIAPYWTLEQAIGYAQELKQVLMTDLFYDYMAAMYGNLPNYWEETLAAHERWRVLTNYFTRMRFLDKQGHLNFSYKGTIAQAPEGLIPWFEFPNRQPITVDIVFGHWAALEGHCPYPHLYAIDSGCVWGRGLTALCLQDRQRFII